MLEDHGQIAWGKTTTKQIEQLETVMLSSEQSRCYSDAAVNEIFRTMHTIKSSAAMMTFHNISQLAHHVEDLFYCLREDRPENVDFAVLCDLVFASIDFIKIEMEKIKAGRAPNGSVDNLVAEISCFLHTLQESVPASRQTPKWGRAIQADSPQGHFPRLADGHVFKAVLHFQDGCQMEDARAFGVVHRLKQIADRLAYIPADIVENDDTVETIRRDGFQVCLQTNLSYEQVHEFFMQTVFLHKLSLVELKDADEIKTAFTATQILERTDGPHPSDKFDEPGKTRRGGPESVSTQQNFVSVSVSRLDALMDLVGEMVIAEAMVVQNPDLEGLELSNFSKAAEQLNKITTSIQDIVMSVRMVSLAAIFQRMRRVVRDMCKSLDKQIELKIIGEETEVDKNIIERVSDPLMHLVRNAVDHGIESWDERAAAGKRPSGTITLEARNLGSDVLITVKDDGRGLERNQVLKKARQRGLIAETEQKMDDQEVFSLILLPGFSMKEAVSEYSGRGVGMNVVSENIRAIGGSVTIDSTPGVGTSIGLKIPLTLAIIDGMNLKVGTARYTLPTVSISESFRPLREQIIVDPDGNEMIIIRGQVYPILRLHRIYGVDTEITNFWDGILIKIEHEDKSICLFADELSGQQQVVVKSLPAYIGGHNKITGIAGCTLLGDGSISLILEPSGLINLW